MLGALFTCTVTALSTRTFYLHGACLLVVPEQLHRGLHQCRHQGRKDGRHQIHPQFVWPLYARNIVQVEVVLVVSAMILPLGLAVRVGVRPLLLVVLLLLRIMAGEILLLAVRLL